MTTTAEMYQRWADIEAQGSSLLYEQWARAVAESPELIELIDSLSPVKRQPNLVFAAARWHGAPLAAEPIVEWLTEHWAPVEATVLARSTQTNEVARCAAILMAMKRIPGPIALLELGAAAGLCLLPDLYRYRYRTSEGDHTLELAEETESPTMECTLEAAKPPTALPQVVWRRGIDLDPVDLEDPAERLWLETLVWPEHHERRERLHAAIVLARRETPRIDRGDLLKLLPEAAADAPAGATLVITHSAVLAYLAPDLRARAVGLMRATGARVISLEGVNTIPEVAALLPPRLREDRRFVLAMDGEPLGLAAPHGGTFSGIDTALV